MRRAALETGLGGVLVCFFDSQSPTTPIPDTNMLQPFYQHTMNLSLLLSSRVERHSYFLILRQKDQTR